MIAGLPMQIFLWVTIPPVLGLVMALVYGITFKDDNRRLTFEDIFRRNARRKDEDGNACSRLQCSRWYSTAHSFPITKSPSALSSAAAMQSSV